jgi:alcohol dehydrogenase (cytochrome c)
MSSYLKLDAKQAIAACVLLPLCGALSAKDSSGGNQNWATIGGTQSNQRYSPLSQINLGNVSKLKGAWVQELGVNTRTAPVVINGALFTNDAAKIYALNAKTGERLWVYTPERSNPAREGVAVAEGKVFCGLADGHVIAVDQTTGKLAWTGYIGNTPEAGYKKGTQLQFTETIPAFDPKVGLISAAPVYFNGKVIIGLSGGDGGTRAKIAALDAATGKNVWEWWVAPKLGEPGSETWPPDNQILQLGGGAVWTHGAVDPELGVAYFGTGNAVPVLGGEVRPGNNLYMASIVALDLNTGKLKWYYQLSRHDLWEMDVSTPPVIFDPTVNGRHRKAVAVMRTDGYLFVFDRDTGQPLVPIEDRPVKQDMRLYTVPSQPYPKGTDQIGPNCVEPEMLPPGFVSGCYFDPLYYDHNQVLTPFITVRQAPMSFDPQTGYFYIAAGQDNPYATLNVHPPGAKEYGITAALDSKTHKIVWQKRSPWVLTGGSGILTTAGGLMFRMEGDGNFLALNAKTGQQVWKFQTGYVSGPTVLSLTGGAASAAYEIDGEEYITAAIGKGFYAFKLNGPLAERTAPPTPPTEYGFQGIIEALPPGGEIRMSLLQHAWGPSGAENYVDPDAISPSRARVPAGQAVKFSNYGVTTRTIVAADGSWTTGPVAPGQSASVTIDKPGRYTFYAKEAPWVRGQLVVQ